MAYLLGIDLGTSSLRAGIFRDDGTCAGIAWREYGIDSPESGHAEQNPLIWWSVACESIGEAISKAGISGSDIDGISFSGQMHGTVLLDRYDDPVVPAIIWADTRSGAECTEINGILGRDRINNIIMNRIFPGTQAATIRWMHLHAHEAWTRVRRILTPKDYLRFRMCGLFNTEPSDGAATLLFDVGQREWSEDVLNALGIPLEYMPYVVNSDQHIAETEGIEEETGLPDGIPLVMGGGDQPCAALGNGVIDEGTLMVTIGTGGQLFAPKSIPGVAPDLSLNTFCHLHHSRWYVMGATLSAGLSLRWFRDTFAPGIDYDTLTEEAAAVSPGSRGLTFVPHLAGKRSPDLRPDATGSFTGIDTGHSRGHYVRAIMEGVAFDLRENLDVMRSMELVPERSICSGGGAKSRLWMQIVADVFGIPVEVSTRTEAACFGAALLAGIGTGIYDSFHEAASLAGKREFVIEPIEENAALYNERYDQYKEGMNKR